MPTPLYDRCYAVVLILARHAIAMEDVPASLRSMLLQHSLAVGDALEYLVTAPDAAAFDGLLGRLHAALRRAKQGVRLLDDLGAMPPDHAVMLADAVEQALAVVLAALRTRRGRRSTAPVARNGGHA